MSVDWADGGPPSRFQVEMLGGPFDGSRFELQSSRWSGLPPDYWDIPIPQVSQLFIIDTSSPNIEVRAFQRARYRRGEAMRDSDHVWPFNFMGTFD